MINKKKAKKNGFKIVDTRHALFQQKNKKLEALKKVSPELGK